MKKRFIVTFVAISTILTLLTGCDEATWQTIYSSKTEQLVGSYSLFITNESEEYLEFLENFDDSKYQIVDISNGLSRANIAEFKVHDYYMVTYKAIE